jgi:hypothetical protein
MKGVESIRQGNLELALIIRAHFRKKGIHFFTPNDYSQQIAYMRHPKGHVVDAHTHNRIPRKVEFTREVLMVRSGLLRVDLYSDKGEYVISSRLSAGDVVLLAHGGHGLEILEDSEIIEVKQGPYAGAEDKKAFGPVKPSRITFRGARK